uniref:Magnesium transporter n=1 Tax=Ciona intestinalis TaxID=7719 RepID=F6Q3E6_CIOIN
MFTYSRWRIHGIISAGFRRFNTGKGGISQKKMVSTKIPKFKIFSVDLNGNRSSFEVTKSSLYHELGLTVRDLRFQHVNMVAVRNKKIVVRFQNLKAIICTDAVLLIDPPLHSDVSPENEIFTKLWNNLPALITGSTLYTTNLPFEYRVLEAVFTFNISSLTTKLSQLEPDIQRLLTTLTDPAQFGVDRSLVHILLNHSTRLNAFATIVREYCATLEEILDCDDDIRDLCITVGEGETRYKINLQDEMETLLDTFLRSGEEIGNKVAELEGIDNSNTAILINLDSHRNLLLRLELQLTMGMFSCTLFGMLGMAFGMNLDSSLEENPIAFWAVSGLMFAGAGIFWRMLL